MIHTARFENTYFVLDVESGSVHTVDKLAYLVLNAIEQKKDPEQEITGYTENEIDEVLEEIEALKKEDLLFSKSAYDEQSITFPSPVVKALCLNMAHDCNLRCTYCFADKEGYTGEHKLMPVAIAKQALDYLVRNSKGRRNLEVDFFGGEPLLNFEAVKKAVEYGRELQKTHDKVFRFTVTTNGYNLTDEMIDFINEEMKNVVISIDGRQKVHDAKRKTAGGRGTYERIVKNAKKLVDKRGDKEYYIRGTFTSDNLDFSNDVLAVSDAGFHQISIEPVVGKTPDCLTEENLPAIKKEYEKLALIYEKRRKTDKWFNFYHFMVDLDSGPCLNKRLKGCGAGSEYLAVSPDGKLYPCHQFVGNDGFLMGDVFTDDIDLDIQKRFLDCHVYSKAQCRECWAKYYCSGGCMANAFHMNNDFSKPYAIGCEMEKKRIEIAIALDIRKREEA